MATLTDDERIALDARVGSRTQEVESDRTTVEEYVRRIRGYASDANEARRLSQEAAGGLDEGRLAAVDAATRAEAAEASVLTHVDGVNWRGTWSDLNVYAAGDRVSWRDYSDDTIASYRSLQPNEGREPGVSGSEAFWEKIASAGSRAVSTEEAEAAAEQAGVEREAAQLARAAAQAQAEAAAESVVEAGQQASAAGVYRDQAQLAASIGWTRVATLAALQAIVDRPDGARGEVTGDGGNSGTYYWDDANSLWVRDSTDTLSGLASRTRNVERRTLKFVGWVGDDFGSSDAATVFLGTNGLTVTESASVEALTTLRQEVESIPISRTFAGWVNVFDDSDSVRVGSNGLVVTEVPSAAAIQSVRDELAAVSRTNKFFGYLPEDDFEQQTYLVGSNGGLVDFDTGTGGGGGGTSGPGLLEVEYLATVGTGYFEDMTAALPDADIDQGVSVWGQSFALAALRPGLGESVFSSEPRDPDWAVMPAAGLVPGATPFDAYQDLYADETGLSGETVLPELLHHLLARLLAKTGERRRFVGRIVGQGGQLYYSLMRGRTLGLANWAASLKSCVAVSRAAGRRYEEVLMVVCHGEADHNTPFWQMYKNYLQLQQDATAIAQALTGQTQPVKLLFYYPNRVANSGSVRQSGPNIAIRMLTENFPHLFASSIPTYGVWQAEDSHPIVLGYRQLGRAMADPAFGLCYSTGWQGCRPIRFYRTGDDTGRIVWHVPYGGDLVADTSNTVVGYPSDPEDPYYIGPPPIGEEETGRIGGIWIKDEVDGLFGVVSYSISGSSLDLQFSRPFGPVGSNVLMGAARAMGPSIAGDNTNMSRMIFRGDTALTLPGVSDVVYPWAEPFEFRF